MTTLSRRATEKNLSRDEIRQFIAQAVSTLAINNKRVLTIIPDGTRSVPMPLLFELLQAELAPRTAACDYLVALGTHPVMTEAQLSQLLGCPVVDGRCDRARIFNHRWDLSETFQDIGTIPASVVEGISGGRLSQPLGIKINRLLFDYDQILICGPVFPHEVVGFSGGNKYLFPGVSTGEMIHQTHWLGALLGSFNIIGTYSTPVRTLIDLAAERVPGAVACFATVVRDKQIVGCYFGSARDAWKIAAEHSAQVHIRWVERPFQRVLAVLPRMYDDLWTGAKGMYKSEPAIADDGEVILYAPHITEASYTHKSYIEEIGYHCCDYFLKQWSRFAHIPLGVIAHSTHLRGQGTYDAVNAVEHPRIQVTLATGISEARCHQLNLNYVDPKTIDPEQWKGREVEGVLLIRDAGEILYRLKTPGQATSDSSSTEISEEPALVSRT